MKNVTEAPPCSQSGVAVQHGPHESIRMDMPFHQRGKITLTGVTRGQGCRRTFIRRIDNLGALGIPPKRRQAVRNLCAISIENRLDNACVRRITHALKHNIGYGIYNTRADRRTVSHRIKQ